VTFRRSFREGGKDVNRPVDLEGVARVEEAIENGWLLHFPAGTTQPGAPLRKGSPRSSTGRRPWPCRSGWTASRKLLLHKQLPGKLFRKCSIRIHRPLDLRDFYSPPLRQGGGRRRDGAAGRAPERPDLSPGSPPSS